MATVTLAGISKYFGTVPAVQELSCTIAQGEFLALLGPSGCGKTTTLLMLAGIYRPSSGALRFSSRSWYRPLAVLLPKRLYGSTSARGRTTFLICTRGSPSYSVERACARLHPYCVVPCKR